MEEISRLTAELEGAFAARNVEQALAALKEIHAKKIALTLNYVPEDRMARTMDPRGLRNPQESVPIDPRQAANRSST